jgi:DNA-binding PadR family transcriptional regulator
VPAGLNATQGSVLGFLCDGPMTGWDVLQRVERGLARFWNVTPSHVYRELRTLEERGLIKAHTPGVRDRVAYSITAAGRRAFQQWISQPPGPEQIRFPLLVTLWFGRHVDPSLLRQFLDDSRDQHTRRRALYETLAGGSDDEARDAVVRFGIAYEDAVIAWLEDLRARDTRVAGPASRGAD